VNFGKAQDGPEDDMPSHSHSHSHSYNAVPPPSSAAPSAVIPPAPTDPDMKNIIDKLAAYIVKSGPQFEDVTKERQKGNPKFSFLHEGGEYYDYYKYRIFEARQAQNKLEGKASATWASVAAEGYRSRSDIPEPVGEKLSETDQSALSSILDTLVPTKESIKKGKDMIMARPDFASSIAHFMCRRVQQTPDFTAKLNIIYLANDVLHHSSKTRPEGEVAGDAFCDAFRDYLPAMLYSSYSEQPLENQAKIEKLLNIWKTKNIYPEEVISFLESDMKTQANPAVSEQTGANPWSGEQVTPQMLAQQLGSYNAVPPPPSLLPQFSMPAQAIQKQQGDRLMSSLDTLLSTSRQQQQPFNNDRNESRGGGFPRQQQNFQERNDDRDYGSGRDRDDRNYSRDRSDRDYGRDRRDNRGDRDDDRGQRNKRKRSESPPRRRSDRDDRDQRSRYR